MKNLLFYREVIHSLNNETHLINEAGGNYGLFDLIIRHNTLKGYGRMMQNIQMLIWNRTLVTVIALFLTGLAIMVYHAKRKGGILVENWKFSNTHSRKYSHAL